MRAQLLLQAAREARRRVTGELSRVSRPAVVDAQQCRSFAAAPVKADAATPKQREVRGGVEKSQGGDDDDDADSQSDAVCGCPRSVRPIPMRRCLHSVAEIDKAAVMDLGWRSQKLEERRRRQEEEEEEEIIDRAEKERREAASSTFFADSFPLLSRPPLSKKKKSTKQKKQVIDAEHRFGAHNYAPLPVVLERGVSLICRCSCCLLDSVAVRLSLSLSLSFFLSLFLSQPLSPLFPPP